MAGEAKVLRKRKSSSCRPHSRALPSCNHGDQKASDTTTSVCEIDKYTDLHKSKKSVLFQGKGSTHQNLPSDSVIGNQERLSATMSERRIGLMSAKCNSSHRHLSGFRSDSDSVPRLPLAQRRSLSAHPTLRTQPSVTLPAPKPSFTRSTSKSCLSPRNSFNEDQTTSSRSSNRSRQRIERFKLRSPSIDSSDSDECSPRSCSRPTISQPLSPDIIASMTSLAEQNKQAWDVFSNHVKLIDDSTGLISRYPRKTFSSSSVFQKAMHDLYGYTEYGKSRAFLKLKGKVGAIATCASRLLAGAKRANAEQPPQDSKDDEDMAGIDSEMPSKETVENAQRGWRLLRQYVQEMAAEKRMSQSALTWNMLTHTIRGLNNMERTRYELYQKYGLVPTVLSDGTVVQENTMLSERARAAIAARSNNKPLTVVPSRHHSASAVHRNQTYKAIGGFKAGRVNTVMI